MSIYEGYLSFGGNEIVNNTRTRRIAESAQPCPMYWLKGDVCDTMQAALFEDDGYEWSTISSAPWFDPDIPASRDFFGFFATSITEAMDSTRAAARTENITNGGVIGRTRKATKTMRVRGLLMGRGRLGIEYGQAWLSAAVDPGACGQHGTECGLTDVSWFSDCPPERGQVASGVWTEARRNAHTNPSLETNTTGWVAGSGALSRPTDGGYVGAAYGRVTASGAPAMAANGAAASTIAVTPGDQWTLSAYVRGSVARTARIRVTWTGGPAAQTGPASGLTPDWSRISATLTVPAGATAMRVDILTSAGAAGDVLDFDAVLAERTEVLRDYFDGSPPSGDPMVRNVWLGAVEGSASAQERQGLRPQTDDEYGAIVDGYVRYLHDTAAISGPLIINTLQAGDFYAYEVEMIFGAERPWVYGVTRDVDLPPTTPVIIQDVPYNLVPYPSAELAAGEVTVAVNRSTNPSVETNATGWRSQPGAPITAGMLTGARSTALAAVGLASYRVLLNATAAGNDGWFGAQQEVAIPNANERQSINVWAAASIVAGAPVLGNLELVAYWQNAASATLRTDALGAVPVAGGVASVKSIKPPAGTTKVIVRAIQRVTSFAAGHQVQLFVDALAVTTP